MPPGSRKALIRSKLAPLSRSVLRSQQLDMGTSSRSDLSEPDRSDPEGSRAGVIR